ncbi:MAG: hypothetical protein M1835_001644, partial [Candelina submexicana]
SLQLETTLPNFTGSLLEESNLLQSSKITLSPNRSQEEIPQLPSAQGVRLNPPWRKKKNTRVLTFSTKALRPFKLTLSSCTGSEATATEHGPRIKPYGPKTYNPALSKTCG